MLESNKKDQSKPLISVCIQTYNQSEYIQQCIESVVSQKTSFDFEILLGEDESNDGTREICQDLARKYPEKIKLFLHKRENVIYINGKPTGRYNFLHNLRNVKGNYIAFCEGDDYWIDESKLAKQVDFLESNLDYSVCCSQVNIVDSKGLFIELSNIDSPEVILHKDLLKGNFIHTPSVLIRANSLPSILPKWMNIMPMADWPIMLLASQNGKIKLMKQPLAAYRTHDKGVWSTHTSFQKLLVGFKSRRILLAELPKKAHSTLLHSIVGNALYISSYYRDNGERKLALKFFLLYLYYRALKWIKK